MVRKKKSVVIFNEDARKEFVTGFHKRKVARKKNLEEKFKEQLKIAKKRIKDQCNEKFRAELLNHYHESDSGNILNSVKDIKKMINKQSTALMKCDKVFQKKNRLEKLKNRKQAERQKRRKEKEKKKKKFKK
ncbi:hypothetical protein PGB90_007768 [Kerria lacca]